MCEILRKKKKKCSFLNMKCCLRTIKKVPDPRWKVCVLWRIDELNKSVSCAVNLRVEGQAASHMCFYLKEEKASGRWWRGRGESEGMVFSICYSLYQNGNKHRFLMVDCLLCVIALVRPVVLCRCYKVFLYVLSERQRVGCRLQPFIFHINTIYNCPRIHSSCCSSVAKSLRTPAANLRTMTWIN